jgi:hypothetical protein
MDPSARDGRRRAAGGQVIPAADARHCHHRLGTPNLILRQDETREQTLDMSTLDGTLIDGLKLLVARCRDDQRAALLGCDADRLPSCDAGTAADEACWRPARDPVAVPLGTRLVFRFDLDRDHEVLWHGAEMIGTTLHSSIAVARPSRPGSHQVAVEVFDLDGELIDRLQTVVEVDGSAPD